MNKTCFKVLRNICIVIIAAISLIGVSHSAYADAQSGYKLSYDWVDQFQVYVHNNNKALTPNVLYTSEQKFDMTGHIIFNRSPQAGSYIEYDLPYFVPATNTTIPVVYGGGSLQGQRAGVCTIVDGKMRIAFSDNLRSRYIRWDIPLKFNPNLAEIMKEKDAHLLNVPLAFPGAQVINGAEVYPSSGTYPLSFRLPEPSANDDALSNPNAFNLKYAPEATPYQVWSSWHVVNADAKPIHFGNPLKAGDYFVLAGSIGRDSGVEVLLPGTKITYDLPPYLDYIGSGRVALRDTNTGQVVGSAAVENNKLVITRTTWRGIAQVDPLYFKVNSEIMRKIQSPSVESVCIPLSFPNAQVNGIPEEYTSKDFESPSDLVINSMNLGEDVFYLPVIKKDSLSKSTVNFYGSIYAPGRTTQLSPNQPIFDGEPFDFDIKLMPAFDWSHITRGSQISYQLPAHIVSVRTKPVNVIDAKTKEVVGICEAKDGAITFTFTKQPRGTDELVLSSRLKLAPSPDLRHYFNMPFVKRVNIPFAIPFTNIGTYPGKPDPDNPKGYIYYQQPGDLELPEMTFNEIPLENPKGSMGFFPMIIMKNNPGNDEDPYSGEVIPSNNEEDPSDPNLLSGKDLDINFTLAYDGVSLSKDPYYEENKELELKGDFRAKPGVNYLGKRIVYSIPSKYVRLSAGLNNAKIIDPTTHIEIGTITIDTQNNKIILNFTTDGRFRGSFSTKLSFNVFNVIHPAEVGEPLNVPFTIPNAKIDGKPQPAPPVELPEPTIGDERLVLPDRNIVVLKPHRIIHEIPNYYDGKKSIDYVSDESNEWLVGASPLYAPDSTENSFMIGYELPWQGLQINTDLKLLINQYQGGVKYNYLGALDKNGVYIEKNRLKSVLMLKRVWYHTDKDGKPIVEKRRVPVLGPDGRFIPGKYTSQAMFVPKDAVETPIEDTTPPPGFTEKSACGFVIRLVNYPYSGLGVKFYTKIVDLGAAQGMTDKKKLIFKNNWYYGQEVWLKDNPNQTKFFAPQDESYVADMVRDNATYEGELIFDGKYSIRKISENTGKPLAGARFALLRADGSPSFDADGRVLNRLITNDDGYLCYEDQSGKLTPLSELPLLQGTNFILEETQAPAGYQLPDNPRTRIPKITRYLPSRPLIIKNRKTAPMTALSVKDKPAQLILAGLAGAVGIMAGVYVYRRRHS